MRLLIGNLSSKVTEESLRATFSAFGEVGRVDILSDKLTGEIVGSVQMGSGRDYLRAISNIQGLVVDDRPIRLVDHNAVRDTFNLPERREEEDRRSFDERRKQENSRTEDFKIELVNQRTTDERRNEIDRRQMSDRRLYSNKSSKVDKRWMF